MAISSRMLDHTHISSDLNVDIQRLFNCAIDLINVKGSKDEIIRLLTEASELGSSEAMIELGNIKIDGSQSDKICAHELYVKASELGNSSGMRNMGYCYALGIGCEQDKEFAAKWYRRSAEAGNAKAQCNLGVFYEFGRGVLKDDAEAVKWYRLSAENGYFRGQINYGIFLLEGRGIEQDSEEAEKWLNISGKPRGIYHIARKYLIGLGVPIDKEKAIGLLNISSAAGHSNSKVLLASQIRDEDPEMALKLLLEAAEKGNSEAIKQLNEMGKNIPAYTGMIKKLK